MHVQGNGVDREDAAGLEQQVQQDGGRVKRACVGGQAGARVERVLFQGMKGSCPRIFSG